jgi:hypothetical protein
MTRLITKAALLSACGMLVAVAAMAGVPSPGNSTYPLFIRVVGTAASVPDSVAGKFTVIVRDVANNTIAGSFVTVDFSACPDIKIASTQNANYTTNCTNHTVSAYTSAAAPAGSVGFTILGNSFLAGTYAGLGCAKIYADGVLLTSATVAAFDLDAAGGVTTSDLSVWMADLGTHIYRGRADYDANSIVNTSDLSVWMAELGTHRSSTTNTTCP